MGCCLSAESDEDSEIDVDAEIGESLLERGGLCSAQREEFERSIEVSVMKNRPLKHYIRASGKPRLIIHHSNLQSYIPKPHEREWILQNYNNIYRVFLWDTFTIVTYRFSWGGEYIWQVL